ncbi:unnamed protein product [Closterium sp. NIES-64]|nr:unnamed protein product [Closterium sp. NIES-64]
MDPAPPVRPQVVRGRNALVGAALVAFVGGVYAYTMRAVGGSDDIGDAVRRLEKEQATNATNPTKDRGVVEASIRSPSLPLGAEGSAGAKRGGCDPEKASALRSDAGGQHRLASPHRVPCGPSHLAAPLAGSGSCDVALGQHVAWWDHD